MSWKFTSSGDFFYNYGFESLKVNNRLHCMIIVSQNSPRCLIVYSTHKNSDYLDQISFTEDNTYDKYLKNLIV